MLLVGVICGLVAAGFVLQRNFDATPSLDQIAASLGLTIHRIDVGGNRYTREDDVVGALALPEDASQLTFNTRDAQQRIEALPWVLAARIHRSLPDGLLIEITERKPAAVWRQNDRDVLLDKTGRELSTLTAGSDLGLPVFTGDDAGVAAANWLALSEQHPQIARRTLEIRRIEGRRWSLQLAGGALLHLPGDGVAAAVAWLESQADSGLLDRPLAVIDLRVPGQLVVRETEPEDRTDAAAPAAASVRRARPVSGGPP